jgi:dTDP-4-amino-4,6-dideoxygalactose transaminase
MGKHVSVAEPILGEEEYENIEEVLDSGRFLQGPKVAEFEEKWADKVGVDHAIAVSNCTVALQLSLKALGLEPGDEVIVPSLTFGSTATAVVHQACVPVFADIDADLYTLDHTDIERCITDRTEAILPVHLYGHPAEMDEICDIADQYDLAVIEDAAQAHGASYKSEPVGSIGDVGCFSFYATKNITTGEGGIITTDNDAIAEVIRLLRNHGMANRDEHITLGYNYRMSELHAALGVAQIDRLEEFNVRRTEISERYQYELASVEWLNMLPVRDYVDHAYFWAPFAVDTDEIGLTGKEVWRELKDSGVETRHRYTEPLYNQPVFEKHRGFNSDFPWSENEHDHSYGEELPTVESIVGNVIGLPNHPNLSPKDVDFVIKTVREMK